MDLPAGLSWTIPRNPGRLSMDIRRVLIEQVEPWEKNPRGIKLICQYCNREFFRYPSNIKGTNNYCSQKCFGLTRQGKPPNKNQAIGLKYGRGWNKGKGMTPTERRLARHKAWTKYNNKPERKKYMRQYDIRYGRYSINKDYWVWLCEFLDYRCQYCGNQFPFRQLEIDHIIPISKGGTSNWDNIQPLCRRCNCKKKNHDFIVSNHIELAQKTWQPNV